MAQKSKSKDIRIIRVYDAPVKLVWEAWTDLKHVSQWWGPRGFTLTTKSKDLRPGGHWSYIMHGPDGTDYPNKTIYYEVDKYSRLVYDHGGSDDRPPLFRVTVLFSEEGGKTKMDMTMTLPSPEAAEEIRKFIKKAGGDSTWDRLAEHLDQQQTGKDVFVINRSFGAPIDVVFDLWTQPQHLVNWVPPQGLQMKYIHADIKSGGKSFCEMSDGKNLKMHARVEYLEIQRPHRIVYTQQFCDENEKPTRHPFSPNFPETLLTTVTLTEESSTQTRVTLRWEIFGKATPEEIATFAKERAGMTVGWTGSFDQLENHLEKVQS